MYPARECEEEAAEVEQPSTLRMGQHAEEQVSWACWEYMLTFPEADSTHLYIYTCT